MRSQKFVRRLPCDCKRKSKGEVMPDYITCGCGFVWCNRCHPAPAGRCPNEANHIPARDRPRVHLATLTGVLGSLADLHAILTSAYRADMPFGLEDAIANAADAPDGGHTAIAFCPCSVAARYRELRAAKKDIS